ncbi:MAG TPA: CbtA family protein [Pyrinomonadaceae bacterium]
MRDGVNEEGKGRGREADVWKGLAAGLLGGLVASLVMNQFQEMWSRQTEGIEKPHGAQALKPSGGHEAVDEIRRAPHANTEEQEDATEKIASAVSENIFNRHLAKDEKELAGALVHYAYGAMMGAVYGVVAEFAPQVSVGAGLPFGAVFWVAADEVAVPLLGLAEKPDKYPLSTHAYALCSHLVYGLTAEAVRRTLRRI